MWKEKKIMRDSTLEALTIKNNKGERLYDPDSVKEHTAMYYENLYKGKEYTYHPYHDEVNRKMTKYVNDKSHDGVDYNMPPTVKEIYEAIMGKTNGKPTTDIKNEMLKRPGETMSKFITPLIHNIWEKEEIPSKWNKGSITSIWKGRGDKGKLESHRGITTSSAIGTILNTLIDNRIQTVVPFTQAQGGGKKGSSTCDHLFILRAIIDIAKKDKKEGYVTYYDVSKAYDHADSNDMLVTMWDHGFKGKAWRLLAKLNTNLKVSIKTRHGETRTVEMFVGGKQGSRLTGRMFGKQMDTLADEMSELDEGFSLSPLFKIPVLLWVNDVITFAEGNTNQERTLSEVDNFGRKHKLQWGKEKCKVMHIGKHHENEQKDREWKLGDLTIDEFDHYKYLGDEITSDGKSKSNLEKQSQSLP